VRQCVRGSCHRKRPMLFPRLRSVRAVNNDGQMQTVLLLNQKSQCSSRDFAEMRNARLLQFLFEARECGFHSRSSRSVNGFAIDVPRYIGLVNFSELRKSQLPDSQFFKSLLE
jgi:hypothetical protein